MRLYVMRFFFWRDDVLRNHEAKFLFMFYTCEGDTSHRCMQMAPERRSWQACSEWTKQMYDILSFFKAGLRFITVQVYHSGKGENTQVCVRPRNWTESQSGYFSLQTLFRSPPFESIPISLGAFGWMFIFILSLTSLIIINEGH